MALPTQLEKAQRFVDLHREGCFVIPNPWDAGSARLLETLGFQALASTSAGFAFSLAKPDMDVTREQKMEHLRLLCATVSLPVSTDLENGFGHRPEDCAQTITLAAQAGVVGGSIEDARGDAADPIYDIALARERVQAAVEAARNCGFPFTLTARAENLLWGRKDLDDTIRRLQAYQEAGADVLYAPGLRTVDEVRAVVQSLDKPVNVLAGTPGMQLTLAQLRELGVRRVSVGGALARAAYSAVMAAGKEMLENGTFAFAQQGTPNKTFNDIFRAPRG
jgi:2-methylisocitrate lyase-like PEP mutase family enzyme